MTWLPPQRADIPYIIFQGVHNFADGGNPDVEDPAFLSVNVSAVRPYEEPLFEPVECFNNTKIVSKYFKGGWEVECIPFLIDYKTTDQNYLHLEYLLKNVFRRKYVFLIVPAESGLSRAGLSTPDNLYWTGREVNFVKIEEILKEEEPGFVRLTIRCFRDGVLI